MDHEAICDCPFLGHCATFSDRLIDPARKTAGGLGCRGENDVYRGRHCHTFSCSYLSIVISDALRPPGRGAAGR